ISLPTGAGKTGVIATIAHFSSKKNVLVVCHRSAVKDQILKQRSGEFFEERIPQESIPLKPVWSGIKQVSDTGVYVTTFQKLSSTDVDTLKAFTEAIDLIIIDEGHSEPSPVWSKISRAIKAHKIIITATPYRNDLFKFDVSPGSSFIYTFKHALEHKVLCGPKFESVNEGELSERIKVLLNEQPDTKCIIKCKKHHEIAKYEAIFSQHY
ncbi:DEAD/DEAH box helicase family protein, partial [Pseudomonas syringae pv. actinidiae]|nr:DEAD/DEAH box helicase family protein [Pseudomonas syringae pv. actinidiae]